jgi:hypothetical protein
MIDHPDRRLRRRPSMAMILNEIHANSETTTRWQDRARDAASVAERRTAAADRLAAVGKQLAEAETRIQEVVQQLADHGYDGKMYAVLPGPAGHAWIHLVSRHFHRGLALSLPLADDAAWLDRYLPGQDELRRLWTQAGSPHDRVDAAGLTTAAIREASRAAHADLWQLAVTEHRTRLLCHAISAMLNPRLLERLRQAVHK